MEIRKGTFKKGIHPPYNKQFTGSLTPREPLKPVMVLFFCKIYRLCIAYIRIYVI